MVLSFTALASVAILLVVLSTTITYVSVITLNLPFLGVLAAMVVVGVLNAILRRTVISNFELSSTFGTGGHLAPHSLGVESNEASRTNGADEVRKNHPATATRTLQATDITPTEVGFLFVAYLVTAVAQFYILRSRFTFSERTVIVAVTGVSNTLFRSLL